MADPTFVGIGPVTASDFSSDYAIAQMPAGLQSGDVLLAFSPGTGGTGSHGWATPGGAESDQWMATGEGFTNGYVGNVFNIHYALWARWKSGVTYNVGFRNFLGSGFMLAFRNVNWFSLTSSGMGNDAQNAIATGTLTLPTVTNTVTNGPVMDLVILSQFWSSGSAPFTHCTFDMSSIGGLTNVASFVKTNQDYAEILWGVRQPGEDFTGFSVPFSNAQALAFRNVTAYRAKTLYATDEVLPYGL